jgi:hypothetical protein
MGNQAQSSVDTVAHALSKCGDVCGVGFLLLDSYLIGGMGVLRSIDDGGEDAHMFCLFEHIPEGVFDFIKDIVTLYKFGLYTSFCITRTVHNVSSFLRAGFLTAFSSASVTR